MPFSEFAPVDDLNPLPVVLASPSSTQSSGYTSSATVTRAANQTPYNIGDVVGGAIEFATAGPSAGSVIITDIRILWNITALPSGMGLCRWHFYSVTPPSAIADNSPFTLASGDRASYLGHVDGLTVAAVGTGTLSPQGELNAIVKKAKLAGTSLFAYLETLTAYTPAANSETATAVVETVAV